MLKRGMFGNISGGRQTINPLASSGYPRFCLIDIVADQPARVLPCRDKGCGPVMRAILGLGAPPCYQPGPSSTRWTRSGCGSGASLQENGWVYRGSQRQLQAALHSSLCTLFSLSLNLKRGCYSQQPRRAPPQARASTASLQRKAAGASRTPPSKESCSQVVVIKVVQADVAVLAAGRKAATVWAEHAGIDRPKVPAHAAKLLHEDLRARASAPVSFHTQYPGMLMTLKHHSAPYVSKQRMANPSSAWQDCACRHG